MKKYYIDESSNTGNIKIENQKDHSEDHPYFILGALSLNDNQLLEMEKFVDDLKLKYKIQMPELKASKLYRRNKPFLKEIFEKLKELDINIFIELIEKRYFVCMQIVEAMISPVMYKTNLKNQDELMHEMELMNMFSDYLRDVFPINYFEDFLEVSHTKSEKKFIDFIGNFIGFLEKNTFPEDTFIKEIILERLKITKETFYQLKNNNNNIKPAHHHFIPIEDISKNNKLYNSLPHVNCLTNLILRIEAENYKEDKIIFIHDIQKEFDSILEKNLEILKKIKMPSSDLSLEFQDSKCFFELQLIDIVVGTVNNLWRDYYQNNLENAKEMYQFCLNIPKINLVLPKKEIFYQNREKCEFIISNVIKSNKYKIENIYDIINNL